MKHRILTTFLNSIIVLSTLLALTFSNIGITPAYAAETWQQVGTAGFSAGTAYEISLAFDGSTPYVAYADGGNSNKASVRKFNGTAWEQVGVAGFSAGAASFPSLALYGGTPYVAYRDGANSNKVSVMKFNGTSWEQVGIAGFSAGNSTSVSLAFDNGGTPYVAYADWTTVPGGKASVDRKSVV